MALLEISEYDTGSSIEDLEEMLKHRYQDYPDDGYGHSQVCTITTDSHIVYYHSHGEDLATHWPVRWPDRSQLNPMCRCKFTDVTHRGQQRLKQGVS